MTNILVVEDVRDQALLYEKALAGEGHRVFMARDSREAVAIAELNPPDLVVLDINVPCKDSLEVMKKVLGGGRMVPLVIITPEESANLSELKSMIRGILREKA